MCAQLAISMPFNRAVKSQTCSLFGISSWCLAAGCELFTSVGFIIVILGDELIRAASNSTAVTFALVTEE